MNLWVIFGIWAIICIVCISWFCSAKKKEKTLGEKEINFKSKLRK